MGRGRAKAKQTKVARELKYSSGALDINALTAELSTSGHDEPSPQADVLEQADEHDIYDDEQSRR